MPLVKYVRNTDDNNPTERLALAYNTNGELSQWLDIGGRAEQLTDDQVQAYRSAGFALDVVEKQDEEEESQVGYNADIVSRPAGGVRLSDAEMQDIISGTATNIVSYMEQNPQHAAQVKDAEAAGSNRATVANFDAPDAVHLSSDDGEPVDPSYNS